MSQQQNQTQTEIKKNSTPPQTSNVPRRWHENPNEQQVLLNLLNREGFALEDATYEALSAYRHEIKLHRGDVFEGAPHRDNDRIEIDLWAQSGNFVFLIESKKSEYDWIFLQNQGSAKDVHIISGPQKTASVRNRILNCIDCISKQVVEVLPTDDKTSLYRQTQNQKTKNIMLPVRSARDDLARSAIRQALFNLEILMHNQLLNDETWKGQGHRIFIPLIVTNAPLFSCTYNPSDIDSNADLTKIVLKPITVAAFNHSEILRWGHHYENNLSDLGNPAHISEIRHNDERFKDTHNKTALLYQKITCFPSSTRLRLCRKGMKRLWRIKGSVIGKHFAKRRVSNSASSTTLIWMSKIRGKVSPSEGEISLGLTASVIHSTTFIISVLLSILGRSI